jgi:hypothetical protein
VSDSLKEGGGEFEFIKSRFRGREKGEHGRSPSVGSLGELRRL